MSSLIGVLFDFERRDRRDAEGRRVCVCLSSPDIPALEAAIQKCVDPLEKYLGVHDATSGGRPGNGNTG